MVGWMVLASSVVCVDSTVLDKGVVFLEAVRHRICTNSDEIVQ